MATTLRDQNYRIIGYIDTDFNGNKIIKDEHFVIRGYYDKATNTTKNQYFMVVGHGDILTSLLDKS